MAGIKKFGTFAGVYTPSVLTILGVIMYMRLGWVVGEAGLIGAIIIIVLAHIISVSTGLSISSIATDKKIKTGGIYYILSRSLGLPMGGSIGITLFVGTALSIALYLIGFAENFLSIDTISNFLGMEQSVNSYRIIGTLVLVLLVAIAFISTSLAIKTQFFVLGAIALSLISIFLGMLFIEPDNMPQVVLSAAENHVPIITIFAIFFPAVTGFTAGVAMSGDLKNPKSSIPKGTMWAIVTGLFVYILLAIMIAYFVDRNVLLNDTNFLQHIAIFSPFVVAGIWGATLSSALGGILGAPRIVQAISNDKIGPSFLGKGFGEGNEPRNALIFTFVIAEIGVLIGELDAIAEVVSMFYIAAYGFINLAFALESWASTDFRPSFGVNKWIGIIGFIASFGVMMQLNPGAMFAAFGVMWVIYFILKRKELKSDFGDVWGSVWSSIIRTSITKASEISLEKRNWKPNILLFSGNAKDRPYLLELSKYFVGKYGFLSCFYLKVNSDDAFRFTKDEQHISTEENANGVFLRQHSVKNLYDGIEQISSTYGFAGVEPNTVFLGWGKNTENPTRFGKMLHNIIRLDLNVVLMDYDKRVGFGDKSQIDIWWRGQGQNGNLSLQLVKFLRESESWAKAKLRILIVNPINNDYELLHRQASAILHNLRVEGEVRVINNQIENRSFYEIIKVESINSSIVFIGLPEIKVGQELSFVQRTNDLCQNVGTVILVKASSSFIDLSVGIKNVSSKKFKNIALTELVSDSVDDIDSISFPKYKELERANRNVFTGIKHYQKTNDEKYLLDVIAIEKDALSSFDSIIHKYIKSLEIVFEQSNDDTLKQKIFSINYKAFKNISDEINILNTDIIDNQKQKLELFLKYEKHHIQQFYKSLPSYVFVNYSKDDLKTQAGDSMDVKWFKSYNRLLSRLGKKNFNYKIKYKNILIEHFLDSHLDVLGSFLQQLGTYSSKNIIAVEGFVSELDEKFQRLLLLKNNEKGRLEKKIIISEIENKLLALSKDIDKRSNALLQYRYKSIIPLISNLNELSEKVNVNSIIDEEFNYNRKLKSIELKWDDIPKARCRNQHMQINRVQLDVKLLFFSSQMRQLVNLIEKRVKSYLDKDIRGNVKSYIKYLKSYQTRYLKNPNTPFNFEADKLAITFDNIVADNIMNLIQKTQKSLIKELPDNFEILDEESENLIGTDKQFGTLTTVNLAVVRLMNFILQDEFSAYMQRIITNMAESILTLKIELTDHLRLLAFNIENREKNDSSFKEYLDSQIKSIENDYLRYEEIADDIIIQIEERQRIISEKISIYPFVQAAINLKQYIRSRDVVSRNIWLSSLFDKINTWFKDFAADLWYRQSSSLIFTKNILQEKTNSFAINKKLQIAISNIKSSDNVIDTLPFYYKQLFTNRNNYLSEFWVERKSEEKEIERFFTDWKSANAVALLISGAPGSGKTFMSYRIANYANANDKIYNIIPPINGSTSKNVFWQNLKESLDANSVDNVFVNVKEKSIIIFEDAELWWTKTNDGFDVIDEIHSIINKYSDKFLFVVNINSFAFDFINKLRPLSEVYSHSIFLAPVDARMLKKMIWTRHSLGGLKLVLDKKEQASFHAWDFSILFSKYFRQSKGYPLTAMNAWVNNVVEVKEKEISVRNPIILDISILDSLSKLDLWVLQLFVLHKNLNYSKLIKLMSIESDIVVRKIDELKRLGLLEDIKDSVYGINTLVLPNIINVLKSKEYI